MNFAPSVPMCKLQRESDTHTSQPQFTEVNHSSSQLLCSLLQGLSNIGECGLFSKLKTMGFRLQLLPEQRTSWTRGSNGTLRANVVKSVSLEITSILHSEDQVVRISEVIGVGVKYGDFWKDVIVGVVPRRRR